MNDIASTPRPRWGDRRRARFLVRGLHLDIPLLLILLVLTAVGLVVLYSASSQDHNMMIRQFTRLGIAFAVMLVFAQIPPHYFEIWAPWVYGAGVLLLIAVLLVGDEGKGAQRWLDLGIFRFQPSEMMKIAVPLMVSWYLAESPLPPTKRQLFKALVLILIPAALIIQQPDLGTSLLIVSSGAFVILLAGIPWRYVGGSLLAMAAMTPVLWYSMHDYQRARVLNFINPERDPLGSGYHIIQSKIAIGSGGLFGKGWLQGTQSHLQFLPERSTDFIFAVLSEEFGLIGVLVLLTIYALVITRGLYIASLARSSFSRLLCGSLTMTFFVYAFVNIGMVSGLLPVVGLPLPMVSYGGTSMVTMMAAFGIMMSIQTHRKLLSS
ncbi:MAG: rod shape-determining protein RodA [Gammaproteobacteria bacterium]|nr:rod shape-determining protein RodA [Gammaproteobacteria bacterium]